MAPSLCALGSSFYINVHVEGAIIALPDPPAVEDPRQGKQTRVSNAYMYPTAGKCLHTLRPCRWSPRQIGRLVRTTAGTSTQPSFAWFYHGLRAMRFTSRYNDRHMPKIP